MSSAALSSARMSSVAETAPVFSLPVAPLPVERPRPGVSAAPAAWMIVAALVSACVWVIPVAAWLVLR